MKHITLLMLALICTIGSYAQPGVDDYLHNGVYIFDDTFKVMLDDLFTTHRTNLGLTSYDDMELIEEKYLKEDTTDTIDIGTVHTRFQQKHKGYIVENKTMSTMSKCGVALVATGNMAQSLDIDINTPIAEEDALDYALAFINAPLGYSWEDPDVITSLIELTEDSFGNGDTTVTTFPIGELLIAKKYGLAEDPDNYTLCWKFQIEYLDTVTHDSCVHDSAWVYNMVDTVVKVIVVYVDANTGNIWSSYNPQTGAYYYPYGSVWTWFNGQRNVQTRHCGNCRYTTEDDPRKIYAARFLKPNKLKLEIGKSTNNLWVRQEEKDPATALWNAQMAHEYFKQVHSGSFNRKVGIYTNSGLLNIGAAYYPPNSLPSSLSRADEHTIHVAAGFDIFSSNTLEYISHEMTHALNFERGRVGVGLPDYYYGSAFNEAFADIFGMLTETWVNGWCDWSFGDDGHWGMFERSFHDPQNDFHPNGLTSGATYDVSGGGFTDPHLFDYTPYSLSGPMRKWFNHLSQGEWNWTPAYSGVGLNTASRVTFLTFYYLINNEPSLNSLVQNTLDVAAYHYGGKCNPVWQKTWRAWQDVGAITTPVPCARYILAGQHVATAAQLGNIHFPVKNSTDIDYEVVDYTWITPGHWTGGLSSNNSVFTLADVSGNFSSQEITVIVEYTPLGGGVHMYDTIKTVLHFSSECNDISLGAKPARLNSISNYAVNENVSKIVVYPNPTHDHLTITGAQPGTTLLLMNTIGQQIYVGKTSHAHTVISTSQYAPGVYMLTLIDKNGNKDVRRIIKE